jgi:hypothetical protein
VCRFLNHFLWNSSHSWELLWLGAALSLGSLGRGCVGLFVLLKVRFFAPGTLPLGSKTQSLVAPSLLLGRAPQPHSKIHWEVLPSMRPQSADQRPKEDKHVIVVLGLPPPSQRQAPVLSYAAATPGAKEPAPPSLQLRGRGGSGLWGGTKSGPALCSSLDSVSGSGRARRRRRAGQPGSSPTPHQVGTLPAQRAEGVDRRSREEEGAGRGTKTNGTEREAQWRGVEGHRKDRRG